MNKIKLSILVGTLLGLLDGLLTFLDPEAVDSGMMPMIITGSTIKGLVSGWVIGAFATRYRSLVLGVAVGLLVGLSLSFLVALMPDPSGNHHYVEIMLPGAILGLAVGFVSQRWGTGSPTVAAPDG